MPTLLVISTRTSSNAVSNLSGKHLLSTSVYIFLRRFYTGVDFLRSANKYLALGGNALNSSAARLLW